MADILIVEDEPILAKSMREFLELAGHRALTVGSGEECLEAIAKAPPDLVLLDYRLPGMDGLEALRRLREQGSGASVVMVTAHGNMDTAVQAMRSGAGDFLVKPVDLPGLELVVERALSHRRMLANLAYFRAREQAASAFDQIIGRSKPMQKARQFIERLVSTPALESDSPPSVLFTGETGTGKDLLARAIHYAGPRRDGQFVQVNCTALPERLAESELFGHVKGAFTDAGGDRTGLFEIADGGTIFLNEIGHTEPAVQAKLLDVLERRTIRPVGSTAERKVNVHFIAATNRDLAGAIKAGEFREDLYHRVRVLSLHMPPLRDRGDDVLLLAEHFLTVYTGRYGLPRARLSSEAVELLRGYDWPGNVRELSHALESAVLVCDGSVIMPEHLNIHPHAPGEKLTVNLPATEQQVTLDFSDDSPKLEEVEYRIIEAAVQHSRHNLSRAARILGISRDAVRYRLERYQSRAKNPENE